MNGFLLDTNALSSLRRPGDNRALVEFISVQPRRLLHTCSVNLAELRCGIELKQDAVQRAELTTWLEKTIRPLFQDRVHEVTEDVLLRLLFIIKSGHSRGHTYSHQDALIAAVAAVDELVVVTGDETHFVKAGVATLDPWRSVFYDTGGDRYDVENLVSATLINDLGR